MPDRQPPSPSPSQPALPPRVHGIVQRLLAALSSDFRRELDRLLVAVELDLAKQAEQTRDPTTRAQRMAAVRTLQHNGARFAPLVLQRLEAALLGLREQRISNEILPPTTRLEGLRLVDDDEIDEDAELQAIAERMERRSRLPLLLLGQRFGVLAGAPAFDAADLPVGPHATVARLAAAGTDAGIDLDTRLLLYRTFERQLGPDYEAIVESMNALLARERVLPGLTYVPLRRPRRAVLADDATAPEEPARPPASPPAAGTPPTGATPSGAAQTGTGGGYTGWSGSDTGRDDPAARAGSEETVALLRRLLAGREALPLGIQPIHREATAVALSTSEVEAALAALQARSAGSANPPGVAAIRQALLAQSRLQRGHAAALSPEDNQTFELADMFHREVRRQLRPDSPSRAMVDRLQIPLLRVALTDPDLFVDPQHPARRLLNAVAEAGARWLGPEEIDPDLLAQLQHAVERVAQRGGDDASVFVAVDQSLQQHFRKAAQRAEISERRQVEAGRGREKLLLARHRAKAVVDDAMRDRAVPRFVRNVLEHAWVDALTLALLRHGDDSPEWRERCSDTVRIATSAAAGATGEPLDPETARRVAAALVMVGHDRAEADAIAAVLAGTSGDEGSEDASRTELAMKIRARTRLGRDTSVPARDDAPLSPGERAWEDRLRALPPGTWIEFDTAAPDGIVRRRLAWSSPRTGDVLFVNQRGQRVEDGVPADIAALARLMAAGTARVVPAERGRLVDAAWHAALAALHGPAPASSTQDAPTHDGEAG